MTNHGTEMLSQMKNIRTIILMALVLLPSLMMAQEEYEPFIVDGKVWYYEHVDWQNKYIYKVYFEGDTVIDGHECKKLVEDRPGFPVYSPCSCREEGGKVWVLCVPLCLCVRPSFCALCAFCEK